MKYGIGQLVRVKYFKDLVKENEFGEDGIITIGSCMFLREMKKYCGEVYEVKQVFEEGYELFLNDEEEYFFHEDMLELPNKAENGATKHENLEEVEEVGKPKRIYTKRKVE